MKKLAKRILATSLSLTLVVGAQLNVSAAEKANLATGLGIDTSISSSTDATKDANGRAQVDSTIAVLTVDEDGIIVKCVLDVAQTRVAFDAKGVVKSDKEAEFLSKLELGEGYGMKKNSEIEKEWDEQAIAFAEWAVGKTVEEVAGLKTKAANESHPSVPDDPDLATSVTIDVGEFKAAIAKAAENLMESAEVEGEYKTGLGIVTSIGSSTDASKDAAGRGQVDSTIAAVTIDADGVIVQCSIDAAQTRVTFDNKGKVTSDKEAEILSKRELEDGYNMRARSGIEAEWFEQAAAFADWAIGKTIDEITGLKLTTEGDHAGAPDDADLAASVTITVTSFIDAIVKAVENAN